jgi:hypothetical protein
VFVIGCLLERGAGDWTAAAQAGLIPEGVRRHLEAQSKKGKSSTTDAEGGARGGCWWDGSDCAGTLTKQNANGAQRMPDKDNFGAVLQPTAYRWQNDALGLQQDDAVAALRASAGSSGFHEMNHPVIAQPAVIGTDCYNGAITGDVAATMGTPGSSVNASGPTVMQAVAFKPGQSASAHSIGAQEGVACTLEAGGGGNNRQAVAFPINGMCLNKELRDKQMTGTGNARDPMYTVRADGTQHAVAFDWQSGGDSRGLDPKETAQLQRCQTPAVHHAMTVRRLTPVECERLQGFPDNWTLIPWRKKPASECPDGPRYKALGNSMACNCMAWIGEQIAKWEADHE